MATREKTVCFAFPMTTALVADAVVTNLSQITLYIPEASPVFTSVFVDVGFQDAITATGGTITEHRVGLRLGAASYTTVTELDDIANSGENMAGVIGPFDFTSHFTTNWTGTSMTCDLQVYFDQTTGTTLGMRNVTALVYVTYQYDDTAATQIKTVTIPLESLTTALPTAAANFGTSQIPQLTGVGGLLPEASPVIRDWFILIEGNEFNNGTATDFTISANIDGGATTAFQTQEAALASDRFCRWIYRPTAPASGAAHNLQLWSSVANKCHHVTVTLVVTYQFTRTGTTRVLNSLLLPVELASPLGANNAALASRFQREVIISEPGTITLRQSGFRINYNLAANPASHSWRAGGQAFRTHTTVGSVMCGMCSVQQRIDAGSAQGAGVTLARGRNTITIDGYGGSASQELTNVNGYLLINYESDLAAGGIGQHAHTVWKSIYGWNAQLLDLVTVTGWSFPIPEADYWLMSAGFRVTNWTATASMGVNLDVECLAAEGKGDGYYDIYADARVCDAERACDMTWMRGRDVFMRCPQDYAPERLNVETARRLRRFNSTTGGAGILAAFTYHSHTWTAAGSISGHNAALPTTVKLVDAVTDEVMQQQVLSAGTTAFSFTVYDDTEDYYISVYQDETHVGRSGLSKGV